MREKIRYALPRTIPVMAGYIFLGIAFGIVLADAGYHFGWAFFMSAVVFAGSMQFAMVPLMVAGVSPITMAVTTFFVNSRHLFYGLSFVESFQKIKGMPYMVFSLTDETYSVLCGCKNEDPEEKMRDAWFWIALLDQSYWVLGSVIGGILGQTLPIDFTGIDFSMTALFVVILLEQILNNPKRNSVIAGMSGIAAIISLLIFGTGKFLLPALIVTVAMVGVYSNLDKEKNAEGGEIDD